MTYTLAKDFFVEDYIGDKEAQHRITADGAGAFREYACG